MRIILWRNILIICCCLSNYALAKDLPLTLVDLPAYQSIRNNQQINNKPLVSMSYQKLQWQKFCNNYLSPWGTTMVNEALPKVKDIEFQILDLFKDPQHLGLNYRPHSKEWWSQIKLNMQLATFDYAFKKSRRAITIKNVLARSLPTMEPDFFDFSLPGQGYPFDNLQDSAIWAATPLYVVGVSADHAWSLVITPDAYFTWIPSRDLAYVSDEFIKKWQAAVQKQTVAITQTDVSIVDQKTHNFFAAGYIGAIFPLIKQDNNTALIMIPVKRRDGMANIRIGILPTKAVNVIPLVASKKNIMNIIEQLHNRPYGWGGMFFLNDCSQEMKSLFTPFGIWLPRHSEHQGHLSSARDLSAFTVDERLKILKKDGYPFMTLIYIGSHVMLYIGEYDFDNIGKVSMTYQNVWGLHGQKRDWRYVIGQSVLLPLVAAYPDYPKAASQAEREIFWIINLNEL